MQDGFSPETWSLYQSALDLGSERHLGAIQATICHPNSCVKSAPFTDGISLRFFFED